MFLLYTTTLHHQDGQTAFRSEFKNLRQTDKNAFTLDPLTVHVTAEPYPTHPSLGSMYLVLESCTSDLRWLDGLPLSESRSDWFNLT
ncbi:hypothetical protein EVAR_39893_1 [Eumeta japonica]|uniref:Uncharacterized protein n=1 Tax=Eumeta variegata TaxID=151549 RepID=A0A4C1WQN9_EUMVA|nr:hypothetical protein EVAR_39893_1 [Eumeta japonica]